MSSAPIFMTYVFMHLSLNAVKLKEEDIISLLVVFSNPDLQEHECE
jgi:hypothetical protein